MSVIYEVTLSRLVRETATFYVAGDEGLDTELLADAVYEAESGEAADLWTPDTDYCEQGMCTAEQVVKLREPDILADARDVGSYLEVTFR